MYLHNANIAWFHMLMQKATLIVYQDNTTMCKEKYILS